MIYIKDLEELEDIFDSLVPEEQPNLFEEEDFSLQLVETALQLMDEYIEENPHAISEPNFLESFQEEMEELFYAQFEEEIVNNEYVEEDLNELLDFAFEVFFTTFYQGRSSNHLNLTIDHSNKENQIELKEKIDHLKAKPQPTQRTKDWYEFRYNLITASNAYKAFESQSMVNQLIYEKCLPLKTSEETSSHPSMVNIHSPLHWGQKYEPLSVMLYESMYQTKVADFGCIQHEKYSFLGASPDGINVDPTSDRFGRMLEIKNIVNREITGIPKKEYWIQMQLQMEVCDLDQCDFLETKFTEYPDVTSYELDPLQENGKQGIILYFHTKELRPFYVYKPLNLLQPEEVDEWEEKMVQQYESPQYSMIFIKHIYWKLEKLSCVLVLRNRKWFEDHIGQLEKVWRIIEEERKTGYQHRAPNKRPPKLEPTNKISDYFVQKGCLLDLHKINPLKVTKLDNNNNNSNINSNTISSEEKKIHVNTEATTNKVIKIRTESMDETKANL
jgi:putative phage-type endonuclease